MHIQLQQSGLLLRNINIYGICITFLWKKCEKRNQIIRHTIQYLEQPVILSLSRCSAGSLQHQAYAQTRLNRPFNKFKINFVINSKFWVETGRWISLEMKRTGHDRGNKIWHNLIVSRFPNLLLTYLWSIHKTTLPGKYLNLILYAF